MRGVEVGGGVQIGSVRDVRITGLTVDTVFSGRGIALSNGDSAVMQHVVVGAFGAGGDEINVDKFGRVKVQFTWLHDTRGPGNAVVIHRTPQVSIDSLSVQRILQGAGVVIAPAAIVSLHRINIHSAGAGGIWVDSSSVVNLLATSVDSSASPSLQILNSPVLFGVRVTHSGTGHCGSLQLHVNIRP